MKNNQSVVVVAVVFAFIASPVVEAATEGWYAGVGAGKARVVEDMCDGSEDSFDLGSSSCSADDTSTSWKVFAGYQFHPNVSAELGYVDFGKTAEASARGTVLGVASSVSLDWEPKGFTVGAVGTFPVGSGFELLGKLGLMRWDVDLSFSGTGAYADAGSFGDDDTGIDLTFGIGVKYDFNKTVALRAEWDRFNDVGDKDTTDQADIDMLSVGVQFGF